MTCFDFRATCNGRHEIFHPAVVPVSNMQAEREDLIGNHPYPLLRSAIKVPDRFRELERQQCRCDCRYNEEFDFRARDARKLASKWREEDMRRTKRGKQIYKLLKEEERRLAYNKRLREIMTSSSKHADPDDIGIPNTFYMFEKYVSYGFLQKLNDLYGDRASNWRDDTWRENFVQICKSARMAKLKRAKSKRLLDDENDALPCCNDCQCDEIFIDTRFQCECHTRHLNPALDAAKEGGKSKQTAREMYRNGRQKRNTGGESGKRSSKTSPRRKGDGIPGLNNDDYRYVEGSVQTPYYERAAMFFRYGERPSDKPGSDSKKDNHVRFAPDLAIPRKTVKSVIDNIEHGVKIEINDSSNAAAFSCKEKMEVNEKDARDSSQVETTTNVEQHQIEFQLKDDTSGKMKKEEVEQPKCVEFDNSDNDCINTNKNKINGDNNNINNFSPNTNNSNHSNCNNMIAHKLTYTKHWVQTCPVANDETDILVDGERSSSFSSEVHDKPKVTNASDPSEDITETVTVSHHIEETASFGDRDGSNSTLLQEIKKSAAETGNDENVKVDDEYLFSKVTISPEGGSNAAVSTDVSNESMTHQPDVERTVSNLNSDDEELKQTSYDVQREVEMKTKTDNNKIQISDEKSEATEISTVVKNEEVGLDPEIMSGSGSEFTEGVETTEVSVKYEEVGGKDVEKESQEFEVEVEVEISVSMPGKEEEREGKKNEHRKEENDKVSDGHKEEHVKSDEQNQKHEQEEEQEEFEKSEEEHAECRDGNDGHGANSEDENEVIEERGDKEGNVKEDEIEESNDCFDHDCIENNDDLGKHTRSYNGETDYTNVNPMFNFQEVDKYPIFGSDEEEDFLRHVVNNPRTIGESPLFSPMTRRIGQTEKTDLDNLNFSKISAKVCRQRHSPMSIVCPESPLDTYSKRVDSYMATPDSLKHMNRQTISNLFYSPDEHRTGEHVVLPKSAHKNPVCPEESSGARSYNYHIGFPPQEGHNGKHLREIIFRNSVPIQDIIPSDTYQSIQSDHNKFRKNEQKDTQGRRSEEQRNEKQQKPEKIKENSNISSLPSRSPRYHRQFPDVSFPKTMRHVTENLMPDVLPILAHNISRVWREEGRKLKMDFLRHMLQINDVVNGVLATIPHHAFPFTLKPVTIEEGFERRGQFAVDLFLVLEDFKASNCSVEFTRNETITARVNISATEKGFSKFCTKRNASGERILSPKLLMDVFVDTINSYARPRYENNIDDCLSGTMPLTRTNVHFECINKDIVLHIFFPRKRIVFQVRLILVVDVENVPPDLCQPHESKLLNAFVSTGMSSGVYLLARPQNYHDHLWELSFIKARRNLLAMFDRDGTLGVVMMALQHINENILSRDCSEMLLPFHFHVLLIWIQATTPKKERECMRKYLAFHFLRILNGLKRCIVDGQCTDFFWPDINYFAAISKSNLGRLLSNLNSLLNAFGVDL